MNKPNEYQEETLRILAKTGAIITGDHFVYASGRHGEVYVNKDAIYPHTRSIAWLCDRIGWHFKRASILPDVVVGPAMGGIIMSQWVADTMTKIIHGGVLSVYAEKVGDNFALTRGYDELVKGKDVLVVEDIINTGGSVQKVIDLVRATGGNVVGVGALCNRSGGNVTAETLGVPELFAMSEFSFDTYAPEDCPYCKPGENYRPINEKLGKGKKFLAERAAKA